jgi:hypothetical protein
MRSQPAELVNYNNLGAVTPNAVVNRPNSRFPSRLLRPQPSREEIGKDVYESSRPNALPLKTVNAQ